MFPPPPVGPTPWALSRSNQLLFAGVRYVEAVLCARHVAVGSIVASRFSSSPPYSNNAASVLPLSAAFHIVVATRVAAKSRPCRTGVPLGVSLSAGHDSWYSSHHCSV